GNGGRVSSKTFTGSRLANPRGPGTRRGRERDLSAIPHPAHGPGASPSWRRPCPAGDAGSRTGGGFRRFATPRRRDAAEAVRRRRRMRRRPWAGSVAVLRVLKDAGVQDGPLVQRRAQRAMQPVLQVELPTPPHHVREEIAVERGVLGEQRVEVEYRLRGDQGVEPDLPRRYLRPLAVGEAVFGVRASFADQLEDHP